jgi:hypothetical protein
MSTNKIFGYDWQDIQRVQQGGTLNKPVDTEYDWTKVNDARHLSSDKLLLDRHGADGLLRMGYHGCIDRLTRAGLVKAQS